MIPHPLDTNFYGFVNGEFVEWSVSNEYTLKIRTLHDHSLYISKKSWRYRRSFFGDGNILSDFLHKAVPIALKIRICPISERQENEWTFMTGRNGPLGTLYYPLSDLLGTKNKTFRIS